MDIFTERLTQNKLQQIGADMLRRLALAFYNKEGYQPGGYGYVAHVGSVYNQSPSLIKFKKWLDELIDDGTDLESVAASEADMLKVKEWIGNWQPQALNADYADKLKHAWGIWGRDDLTLDELIYLLSGCNTYAKKSKFEEEDNTFFRGVENQPAFPAGTRVAFKIDRAMLEDNPDRDYCQWFIIGDDGRFYDFFLADTLRERFGDLSQKKGAKLSGISLGERKLRGEHIATHMRLDTELLKKGLQETPVRAKAGFFQQD